MTALPKEERAGLVAEIAEVEAKIEQKSEEAEGARYNASNCFGIGDRARIRQNGFYATARRADRDIKLLRARLADLKHREPSDV